MSATLALPTRSRGQGAAGALTGVWRLTWLALRRDRIQLPVWIIVLVGTQWVSLVSVQGLYPTAAERVEFAVGSAHSAATLAFNGIIAGTSLGAVLASQTMMLLSIGTAVMSILCVTRHTRQNEETGRAEMLGASVVGRHAMLTAALLVAAGACVVTGFGSVLVLVSYGLPWAGSIVMSAGIALCGLAFAGVAAVTAQITDGARAANGLALGVLLVAFLLRGIGDAMGTPTAGGTVVVSGWPSWLSPVGWAQQTVPFYADRWLPLVLLAVMTVAGVEVAYAISDRRDVGAGVLGARPGPAAAGPRLRSVLGLAWRLQRGMLIAWVVVVTVVGAAYGSIGTQVDELIGSEDAGDFIDRLGGGQSLTVAYFTAVCAFYGLAAGGFAVYAILRARGEEAAGRLEGLLATAVDRRRWLASHAAIALGGALAIVVLAGVATGLGFAASGGADLALPIVGASLAQAPAALVLGALVLLVYGLRSQLATVLGWALFSAFLLLGQLGVLLGLPQIVLDLSPFSHTPLAPAEGVGALPLAVLLVVAAAFAAAGFAAFRSRDVATS